MKVNSMYRIKHIPTGLYYQPKQSSGNLSKIGKIYRTLGYAKNSVGSSKKVTISVKINSAVYKQTKDLIKYTKSTWGYNEMYYHSDITEWEFEEYIIETSETWDSIYNSFLIEDKTNNIDSFITFMKLNYKTPLKK